MIKKKIAFLGDTSFHNLKEKPNFEVLKKEFENCDVIINLESPITTQKKPTKNKTTIKQKPEDINF